MQTLHLRTIRKLLCSGSRRFARNACVISFFIVSIWRTTLQFIVCFVLCCPPCLTEVIYNKFCACEPTQRSFGKQKKKADRRKLTWKVPKPNTYAFAWISWPAWNADGECVAGGKCSSKTCRNDTKWGKLRESVFHLFYLSKNTRLRYKSFRFQSIRTGTVNRIPTICMHLVLSHFIMFGRLAFVHQRNECFVWYFNICCSGNVIASLQNWMLSEIHNRHYIYIYIESSQTI